MLESLYDALDRYYRECLYELCKQDIKLNLS